MDDLEKQLTSISFLDSELSRLRQADSDFLTGIMEKHQHGESLNSEEQLALDIVAKIKSMIEHPNKQIAINFISIESLAHAIPFLIAENNKRLLELLNQRNEQT